MKSNGPEYEFQSRFSPETPLGNSKVKGKLGMGNRTDSRTREADFGEPSRPWPVIIGGRGRDRRPGTPGASPVGEARHEVPVPEIPVSLSIHPRSARRRRRPGGEVFTIETVHLEKPPANRENPYASLSAGERYECLLRRLAEVWNAVCRRRKETGNVPMKRKLAA